MVAEVVLTADTINLRPAVEADIEQLVVVHFRSFPEFFLSSLGRRFLRLLYSEIVRHPCGILVVATVSTTVVGFAAGTVNQSGFYRGLIRRRALAFALAALPAAVRHPVIIPRLVRALRRPAESRDAAAAASLMSLGVDPSVAGAGIGSRLVEAFCSALSSRGVDEVCLTTDAAGNDKVNRFYQRLGFRVARAYETREGRILNMYYRRLADNQLH
jgi:ribosomal protein S18 acetylase RimI-like enzyme